MNYGNTYVYYPLGSSIKTHIIYGHCTSFLGINIFTADVIIIILIIWKLGGYIKNGYSIISS